MRLTLGLTVLLLAACNGGDPCADDAEPNDDRGLAPALVSGTARGNLRACKGDVDWFNVTLAAGEQLDVHVAIEGGAADAVLLSLHEPGGAPIAGALADGD